VSEPKEEVTAEAGSTAIQLDLYGVKVFISSAAGQDDQEPGSWREVGRAINADLRSITSGIFRLLKETLRSTTRLVRGVGKMPEALARRIEGAHEQADTLEGIKQIALGLPTANPIAKNEALLRIRKFLDKKAAGGLSTRVFSDGQRIVICIMRPVDDLVLEDIARTSLESAEKQWELPNKSAADE
jgi:hypothetical protein